MTLGTQLFLLLMAFISWRIIRTLRANNKIAKEEHEKRMAEHRQHYSPRRGLDLSPPKYERNEGSDTFPPN